jgi:hypothetical protein
VLVATLVVAGGQGRRRRVGNGIAALAVAAGSWLGLTGETSYASTTGGTTAALAGPSSPTLMAGKKWFIKDNDLATVGNVGQYEWVGCGMTTGPVSANDFAPCKPDQVPIYASEATFASDVASNNVPSGIFVMYDNEPWVWTPSAERNNPEGSMQKFDQLAHQNGDEVINAPYGKTPGTIIGLDTSAAKSGADVIDIQAQTLQRSPGSYFSLVRRAAAAIRSASPKTVVLAGLSPDAGGNPAPVADMYAGYKLTNHIVDGYWENAKQWTTHARGCASEGCPSTVIAFYQKIGATAPK